MEDSPLWDFSNVIVMNKEGRRFCVVGGNSVARGDVLGPIGGVLRRENVYKKMYYPGHAWKFDDPQVQKYLFDFSIFY